MCLLCCWRYPKTFVVLKISWECGWFDPCVCLLEISRDVCGVRDIPRRLWCWRSLGNVDGLIHVFVVLLEISKDVCAVGDLLGMWMV